MGMAHKTNVFRVYRHNEHDRQLCTHYKCIVCTKTYIDNLSQCILTEHQILLLSKGPSFIPTVSDVNNFELPTVRLRR